MSALRAWAEVLSSDEVQAIHRASLRLLERTGVRVPLPQCRRRCLASGAMVDEDTEVVRIPAVLMEELLEGCRSGAADTCRPARLEGVISTQLQLIDYSAGTRRPGLVDDVRKGIALTQQLRNFPTANAVVLPADTGLVAPDVAAFQAIYSYSRKPGGTYVLTPGSARPILEMAGVMEREVWFLLDTVSPLQFRQENLEIACMFAGAGQPLYIGSMVMAGATGPVTLAGTLTLHNAELLACLFLVWVLTGQQRAKIYNSGPHTADSRTMTCSFGSPNQALFGIAMSQLGRFYGIDRVANVGLTDSLRPDFQAGFEKAATAVNALLGGVQSIGCQGLVGADQGFSFEQLVLDDEWMSYCNHIGNGIQADEESIAVDLMESLGIGASYIAEEHTARHFRRSYFVSKLSNRRGWDEWVRAGSPDALRRARDCVESTVGDYRTANPVCTPQQFEDLKRVASSSEKETAPA